MNEFRLFAHGLAFDLDAFLVSTALRPDYIWRRGDQRRYACVDSRYASSGVEFALGDGLTITLLHQERVAVAFLTAHRDALRALGRFPGMDTFILGLQYRTAFASNVVGFCLAPSAPLIGHCLDVGCEPVYYVTLDRVPEPGSEGAELGAAHDPLGR
jgi:hypothetical protein